MKAMKIILTIFLMFVFLTNISFAACPDESQHKLEIKLGPLSGCVSIGNYLSGIYKLSLGVGVFLAAIVIVMAGVRYATSGDNGGKQKEAKDDIFQAIFGLLVLFGSIVILRTINPDLADLSKWANLEKIGVEKQENKSYEEEAAPLRLIYEQCMTAAFAKYAAFETQVLLAQNECRAEKNALDKCLKGLGCGDIVLHEDSGMQLIKDGKPIDNQ